MGIYDFLAVAPICCACRHLAVPQASCESRQIGLFRGGAEPARGVGCPIGIDQGMQAPPAPEDGPDDREQARETVRPAVDERQIAQQQMHQQSHPRLPAHGVGAVAEEVRELERLLDLLEEHLDVPAAPVQLGHRPGAPFHVVGQKDHFDVFTVDLDQRHDAPQALWIGVFGSRHGQFNDFIPQDPRVGRRVQRLDDAILQVVLGPADPPEAAPRKFKKVIEVQVGLVEHHDFALLQRGAKPPCLPAVVELGRVDDGALGQEGLQVQPQMALRRRLPPPVLRPVHAVGHQLDRGRVQGVNHLVEPPQISPPHLSFRKARRLIHQVRHDLPVQGLGHPAVAHPVGMAQVVAARRRRAANAGERPGVHAQRVTDVVEPDGVRHLREDQRDHVAPRRERPALGIHAVFFGQARDQMPRNQVAQLLEDGIRMARWNVVVVFFHTLRVEDFRATFQPFLSPAMG